MTSSAETTPRRLPSRLSPTVVGLVVAAMLSVVWLLLPPTGSDLSAQVAHADFAHAHLWHPVDLRWFGGTNWVAYSIVVPPLMGLLGVRLVGALATSVCAALLGLLMSRCHVPRPMAGAVAGALCLVANLVVGRISFAVGVAAALATILALTTPHWSRWALLVGGPVATWAASPLAALFLGLAGAALVIRHRGGRDGLVLSAATAVALAASAWLGQGGYMPASFGRALAGLAACCLVAVATRYPVVRVAAVLAAAGIMLALTVHTQVGVQALRLPALVAAPVAVATSRLRIRLLAPLVAVIVFLVPPLTSDDITATGEPSNARGYYSGLIDELGGLPLDGRVEIPPTLQRWEAVYVASGFPLARGWLTSLDDGYNPLFFGSRLDGATYRRWLHDNAVQYVAVPDGALAEAGRAERDLVDTGLPYLRRIWQGEHWTVYAVANPTSTVTGAQLVSQDAVSVAFRTTAAATVEVRVRWSRWLTITGPNGCLHRAGGWTDVVTKQPGLFRLSSSFTPGDQHRLCLDG